MCLSGWGHYVCVVVVLFLGVFVCCCGVCRCVVCHCVVVIYACVFGVVFCVWFGVVVGVGLWLRCVVAVCGCGVCVCVCVCVVPKLCFFETKDLSILVVKIDIFDKIPSIGK